MELASEGKIGEIWLKKVPLFALQAVADADKECTSISIHTLWAAVSYFVIVR